MQTICDDQTLRTALIVEYDRWERWCTAQLLADQGYLVLGASNGASGLRMAAQNAFDVILLAPSLPEMSGLEVVRQLRAAEATREVPVIMLNAMADDGELKALLSLLDNVPDVWNGDPVNFRSTFNLQIWGAPTSRPEFGISDWSAQAADAALATAPP